jgi:Peptidase A4 family
MVIDESYATYEIVPPGYNLVDASPDQLDIYGIPQKPDAVTNLPLFEFWRKLVSPPFAAKRPTFSSSLPPALTEVRSLTRDSAREAQLIPSRGGSVESNLNWSGAVMSPPWPKRIILAVAGWNAPNVRQPSTPALFTHSNDAKTLVWVGIDGHNGRLPKVSLPQIGTAHSPGSPQFAWWYWWSHASPGAVKKIDDFAISAGDEVLAGLAVLASEDVLYFIKNQSTGEFRSFLARRQLLGAIEPLGSSVEWVVERPTDPTSKKLHPLAAYDPVNFKHCLAMAADRPHAPGRLLTLSRSARMVKMREAFADPYRTAYVSLAARRRDPDGSIGVTCTFRDPT